MSIAELLFRWIIARKYLSSCLFWTFRSDIFFLLGRVLIELLDSFLVYLLNKRLIAVSLSSFYEFAILIFPPFRVLFISVNVFAKIGR